MGIELNFDYKNTTCHTNLVNGKGDGPSVLISGREFTILSSKSDAEIISKLLPQMGTKQFKSISDLADCIKSIEGCRNVSIVDKSHQVGVGVLLRPELGRTWMQQEKETLPPFRRLVAERCWEKFIDGSQDPSMLKKAVVAPASDEARAADDFDLALKSKNKELFCSLFNDLEFYLLYRIVGGEQLGIELPDTKPDKVDLRQPGLVKEIQEYLKDRNFSGIVALSDGVHDPVVVANNIANPSSPMSIHSLTKICTGMLVLSLIENKVIKPKDLNEPIKLDPKIMASLPPKVQKRLAEATLKEVMLHTSGLGDYLDNYQKAIQDALDKGEPPPAIGRCEDLLSFSEPNVYEKGDEHYSNIGLLLVGLAMQEMSGQGLTYEELLKKYVLDPAKIEVFSPTKPKDGVYNLADPMAAHIYGGPGGGHWSTAVDLLRLGDWIGKKAQDPSFAPLLNDHGGEFYNGSNLWHAGAIPSASAHLTHLGEQQLTVAVLSNDAGFCEATAIAETIQDHLIL